MRTLLIVVAGLIVALAGVMLGAWWAPFLVGAAFGLSVPRLRLALPLGTACGLVAWLLPLALQQVRYGIGASADALAAIMGFGHAGAVPVVLSLLVGALLGLSGAWLAGAARLLVRPAAR